MNHPLPSHAPGALLTLALAAMLTITPLITPAPALAAPGAHGPNGEHLDAPATMRAASARPRAEASTEAFELVAELRSGELVVVVDRYETNEPVLGATLEVETGSLKTTASFRAEQGDYVVTDAAFLKALAVPGEHALLFTLVAGKDSDLLDGKLVGAADGVPAAAAGQHAHGGDAHDDAHEHGHGHDHTLERATWIGGGLAALGLLGGVAWMRQRRKGTAKLQGGL